jgi:sugar/nucleoside kinase (ribokinase family)
MSEVVCLGILVADVIARPVDQYPKRGELTLCQTLYPSIGGCAANTGIGIQKLGIPTTIMGKVGPDGFGDFVQDTLNNYDVSSNGVVRDATTPTSATMVMIGADSERSFIHSIGANASFTEEDVNWDLVRESRLLHIAGHFLMPGLDGEPCARVLERARSLGVLTALDTAGHPTAAWPAALEKVLPHVDYFVPSFSEAKYCVVDGANLSIKELAGRFLDMGVGAIGLKYGAAGSYICTPDGEWHIPPFRVPAVDATGAGDAFAAGFLAGVLRGLDWPDVGLLANATGACCVTQMGTVDGILSFDETMEFIRQNTDK